MTGPTHAMILAAGFGTRMGPLTQKTPKPLLPVGGRAMIDIALDHAAAAGVRDAVVNLHYRGAQIRDHLAARTTPRVQFSEEMPEILDTGGGIAKALDRLGPGPFHVMNSDAVWAGPNPLEILCAHWSPGRFQTLLLLVPVSRTRCYTRAGDFFLDAEGGPPRRRGAASSAPLVYSGAHLTVPESFAGAPRGAFSLNTIWDGQLAEGRLGAVTYSGTWVDVGTPEGLAAANALAAQP